MTVLVFGLSLLCACAFTAVALETGQRYGSMTTGAIGSLAVAATIAIATAT